MSRYTVFLPAPSSSELKKDVQRDWIVEQHVLDVDEDSAKRRRQRREDMELDVDEYGSSYELWHSSTPLKSKGGLLDDSLEEEDVEPFSQTVPPIPKTDIVDEIEDLDEQYGLSQDSGFEQDSDIEWSISGGDISASFSNTHASFSLSGVAAVPPTSSYPQPDLSQSSLSVGDHTTNTSTTSADLTGNNSDASVHRLPSFRIPLNRLASLRRLIANPYNPGQLSGSTKISVLVGLVEVDGLHYVRIQKGVDAGKEVALLKIVMGETEGAICKLTVWRERAEEWAVFLQQGDVVLFEDVLFTRQADGSGACTGSAATNSRATVCYRTNPVTPADRKLRPDLRLAAIDPAMARVAQTVQWMRQMAGTDDA